MSKLSCATSTDDDISGATPVAAPTLKGQAPTRGRARSGRQLRQQRLRLDRARARFVGSGYRLFRFS